MKKTLLLLTILLALLNSGCGTQHFSEMQYSSKGVNLEGEDILNYESGQLLWKAFFKEGRLNGEAILFFKNGVEHLKMVYKNGLPVDGTYRWKNKDGKVIAKCSFKNGMPYEGSAIYEVFDENEIDFRKFIYFHTMENRWVWNGIFSQGKQLKKREMTITSDGSIKVETPFKKFKPIINGIRVYYIDENGRLYDTIEEKVKKTN